jgi:uncharacterized protein (DUF427 family)
MTLTIGTGPFGKDGGDFNFDTGVLKAHTLYFEDSPKCVRAVFNGETVVDSRRAKLLHETGLLPVYYFPEEDLRHDLLEPTDHSTHCPFKGDASYRSLRVGDRLLENAVWLYEEPIESAAWLAGHASLYWEKADAWFAEDERVFGPLRDPYHRVDVAETSRAVRVTAGGKPIAETARAKLVFETGAPVRVYVPGADVAPGVLTPNQRRTVCPYKGEATYWDVGEVAAGAWSYETPLPDALGIRGHVSFDGEGIEVDVAEPAGRFALA